MTLLASGICWTISRFVEPPFNEQIRQIEKSISNVTGAHGGLELMVLSSAMLFLVSGYELTRRLRQSTRVRPFYASMLVTVEVPVFIGVTLLPALMPGHNPLTDQHDASAQPAWLSWILGVAVVLIASRQTWLIRKKIRSGASELSLWKFEGRDLVRFGLVFGSILACSGMILMMVALDIAFISVIYISALIHWGNSITKPLTDHFDPQDYGKSDNLSFWVMSGLGYVSLCLAIGLGTAMVLSALEFIRFNSYRLHKMKKARQGLAETLAINE
jgi:hypothetical protein